MSEIESRIPPFDMLDDSAIKDFLFVENGVESLIREKGVPPFFKGTVGYQTVYTLILPPDKATRKSYFVLEMDGYVCYLDDNDGEGYGCRGIMLSEGQGKVLGQRMIDEVKRIKLEKMHPIKRNLISFLGRIKR